MFELQKCLSMNEFYNRLHIKLMLLQFEEENLNMANSPYLSVKLNELV